MKFAVVILACVAAASAQFNSGAYNPNPYRPFGNQYKYKPTPAPYRPTAYTPVAFTPTTPAPYRIPVNVPARIVGDSSNAETLKYGNDVNPDGSFNYFYETNNGIAAQAQGTPRDFGGNPPVVPSVIEGSFSWTSPEGVPVNIAYVADENGYQPSGDAIPTSPPVPPQIARALAYIAARSQK